MKCPKCGFEQGEGLTECVGCGIVFEKYLKRHGSVDASGAGLQAGAGQAGSETGVPGKGAGEDPGMYFPAVDSFDPVVFGGRALVFLGMLALGMKLMFSSISDLSVSSTFLHSVNLPFHEAGHIFFRPLGQFMASLGGTLGQLIMPAICMAAFLFRTRDSFGAAVCLWWLGENFLDAAPYIDDANRLVLPLLGGNTGSTSPYGFHDWEYILTETGLVQHSQGIALSWVALGDAAMAAALLWAGWVLYRQMKERKGRVLP